MIDKPQNIPQETILKLGIEGGSLELKGRRISPNQWEFMLDKSSMGADLDNPWTYQNTGSVTSLDEAIALLSQASERWFSFYLVEVHPEFHKQLYKVVRQRLAVAKDISPQSKEQIENYWSRPRFTEKTLLQNQPTTSELVVGDWAYCMVEYQYWDRADGDYGRHIVLWVSGDGISFEVQRQLWEMRDHYFDEGDDLTLIDFHLDHKQIRKVLDKLQLEHWEIINTDHGETSDGTEKWEKVTLKKVQPTV